MESGLLIALIYGAVCVFSAFVFKIMPMGETKESFRTKIVLNSLAQGVISLLIALFAVLFHIRESVVLYLLLGDIVLVGGVMLIPAFLRQLNENKGGKGK